VNAFLENPEYRNFPLVRRFAPYLHMRLNLASGDIDHAVDNALLTMRRYADTDAALSIVADVASAGFQGQALELMTEARRIFDEQPVRSLKRPAAVYEFEIERLTRALEEDIQRQTRVPTSEVGL
jgi:protein O-mannosyl-transferase